MSVDFSEFEDNGKEALVMIDTSRYDGGTEEIEKVMISEGWAKVNDSSVIWAKTTDEERHSILDNLATAFFDHDVCNVMLAVQKGKLEPENHYIIQG